MLVHTDSGRRIEAFGITCLQELPRLSACMCSGPVRQHPPIMFAPAVAHSLATRSQSLAVVVPDGHVHVDARRPGGGVAEEGRVAEGRDARGRDPVEEDLVETGSVVEEPGARVSLSDLQRYCDGRIAGFKKLRRLGRVEALPRTAATGQVQRTLLVEQLQAGSILLEQ